MIVNANLATAYNGSFYFIAGTGGSLEEWKDGYEGFMRRELIGKPVAWYKTTGKAINEFAGENNNPFPDDLTCLLFPLDGLSVGRLAMFKLSMGDRWFDDVIDNMRD